MQSHTSSSWKRAQHSYNRLQIRETLETSAKTLNNVPIRINTCLCSAQFEYPIERCSGKICILALMVARDANKFPHSYSYGSAQE